jgi:soluble lytic murein transglycosylase-like protein
VVCILRIALIVLLAQAGAGTASARPQLTELYSGTELYHRLARQHAVENNVPFALVDAVMSVESGYNPDARGDAGEVGLMQVLPSTASMLGYTGTVEGLSDPVTNVLYGAQYLGTAWRLANGDICTTVMKYRAGHGETRFSEKSLTYCISVRKKLLAAGYPVTGKVPKATFGTARVPKDIGKVTRLPSGRVWASFRGL